jgi:tRNA G18 (ribose-2'-O)-methylase SpoU
LRATVGRRVRPWTNLRGYGWQAARPVILRSAGMVGKRVGHAGTREVGSTITGVAVFQVDDPGDPRIADYRNIPDRALLERQQVFVAEGRLVVRRLLESDRLVTRSLLVTASALAALDEAAITAIPVYVVPQAVMDTVTGFHIHRGCLAIGERGERLGWLTLSATARRLVVLERVGNADNVGAVFRNAAAFGVDAVLLGPDCADPLYRKAIRTSMAAALSIPFARIDGRAEAPGATAAPWPDALRVLRANGFIAIALTPDPEAPDLSGLLRQTRRAAARVAIVAGHEGEGLTREAVAACNAVARIPMASGHDSLNVATAVAIALYELSHL